MTEEESIHDEDDYNFEIEAGWEASGDKYRCRWCVISNLMNEDNYERIAGIAAGYSGGGAFQVERFYLELDSTGKAIKLIIESGYDAINDPDQNAGINWFEDMDKEVIGITEAAYNMLFQWNDDEEWNEGDQLYLREDKIEEPELQRFDDMIYLRTDDEPYPRLICEAIGLTAGPSFE